MDMGILISSNDAGTCWDALRCADFCVSQKDEAELFNLYDERYV